MNRWKNYFFTADFTASAEFLSAFEVGQILSGDTASTLAAILQAKDKRAHSKDAWCSANTQRDFNLVGAVVAYNGLNSRVFKSNTKYSHVVVLQFPDNGLCPHGDITLQYNREV